jgi:hypothetical protein
MRQPLLTTETEEKAWAAAIFAVGEATRLHLVGWKIAVTEITQDSEYIVEAINERR